MSEEATSLPVPLRAFDGAGNLTNEYLRSVLNMLHGGSVERMVFVSKNGSTRYDGRAPSQPKPTFTEGLAVAATLSPAAGAKVVVVGLDAGTYEEELDIPAYVNLFAPNATITTGSGGTEDDAAISLGAEADATVYAIIPGGNQSAVIRNNTAGTGRLQARILDCRAGSGNCILNKGVTGGVLIVEVEQVYVGTGAGVGSQTQGIGHTHVDIQDVYLAGNSGIGVSSQSGGGIVGMIAHILEIGTPTTTTAIRVNGGRVDMMVHQIVADTAWNVGGAGTLSLFYNQVTGTQTGAGTILTSTPT